MLPLLFKLLFIRSIFLRYTCNITLHVYFLPGRFTKAFAKMLQTQSAMAEIRKFNGLMQEMSRYTGANYTDMDSLFLLYHTFATQSSLGLRLPEWTYNVFPQGKLLDALILDYKLYSYNDELARLNGGKPGSKIDRLLRELFNCQNLIQNPLLMFELIVPEDANERFVPNRMRIAYEYYT